MTADDPSATTREHPTNISARITEDTATFTELLGAFYWGETDRMSAWRSRIDQTTI